MNPSSIIHLGVVNSQSVSVAPLCGDWSPSPNWTTAKEAVTCPRCLERMRDDTADPTAPGQ
jgi:hypothetical protein